jgi:ATP-dependent Clp protease ATP-binding subunit ClpC
VELAIPVLISADERERSEVRPARLGLPVFSGPSLPRLLDDLALHVMETLPKEPPERLVLYELSPYVELKKVKLDVPKIAPGGRAKDAEIWKGRVSVMVSSWPDDPIVVASIPRLGPEEIAFDRSSDLTAAITAHLAECFTKGKITDLDAIVVRPEERLEILTVDAELPTILPSSPRPRRNVRKEKKPEQREPKKRRVISPMTLSAVGENLIYRALEGRLSRAHGREALVEALLRELQKESCAVLLVGPSGVGKTAIVHEAVRRMALEDKPIEKRTDVWEVDGNRIIAGMSVVGAWEARMKALVHELSERRDVLYVRDLPALVYTGRSAHGDDNVAAFLGPHLEQGDLRIIGECTAERLAAVREEAPGFFAHFSQLAVAELGELDTWRVLGVAARAIAAETELRIDAVAIDTVQGLARRFLPGRPEPGRSARLLSEIATEGARSEDAGRTRIRREEVVDHFARSSGLPKRVLWQKEARDPESVRRHFEERIVAQPHAHDACADVVTMLEQGLSDPGRPLASFLFVGPTGVGKTETAKALAEYLFGSTDRLIRFDMSELQGRDAVSRLIGDRLHPDGELTRRVDQNPFSVVLLDEIEKAHPAIFDALLQVLGEGRLTNAAGRTVTFASTVLVMTSNLGVKEGRSLLGFGAASAARDRLEDHYREAAERFFRPELFNRLDRVVPFHHLDREAVLPLAKRLLYGLLGRRGFQRQNLVVDVHPSMVELLADEALDPRWGARAVKRALERRLAVPLANYLVKRSEAPLTIVDVSAETGDVTLEIMEPHVATETKLEEPPVVRSWEDLTLWHRRVSDRLATLLADPRLDRLSIERASLLEDLRSGALDVSGQARLEEIGAVLEGDDLGERIEAIARDHLETRLVEESAEIWTPQVVRQEKARPWMVEVTVRTRELGRLPPSAELVAELSEIERAVSARVRAFARAVLPPEAPLTVSLESRVESETLAELERGLAAPLSGAIVERKIVEGTEERPRRIKWRLEGRGLRALLAPEAGFHFFPGESPLLISLFIEELPSPALPPLVRVYRTLRAQLFEDVFLSRVLEGGRR